MTRKRSIRIVWNLTSHKCPVAWVESNSDELAKIDQRSLVFDTRTASEHMAEEQNAIRPGEASGGLLPVILRCDVWASRYRVEAQANR